MRKGKVGGKIYIVNKKNLGIFGKIAMFVISILWGASFFIQKNTLDSVSVMFLLFFRFGVGALILAICFFPKLKKINKNYLIHGTISGTLLFIAYVAQTFGLAYTTPGKNAFLTAVYCVMVPFIMWMVTKKHPTLRVFLAAIVCVGGIGLISIDGSGFNLGDGLTLICALFYAIQMVYNFFFIKDKDLILFSIIQFATVAVLSLLGWAIFDRTVPTVWNGDLIWCLVYVVICSTVLGFLAQNFGQKHVSPESCALILSLESVFGVFFSVLVYGEKPSVPAYIGFALVFIGVIVSEVDFKALYQKIKSKKKLKDKVLDNSVPLEQVEEENPEITLPEPTVEREINSHGIEEENQNTSQEEVELDAGKDKVETLKTEGE